MVNFVPFEKLSKKAKRAEYTRRRITWGALNPVTRKPDHPKAYNRTKSKNLVREEM